MATEADILGAERARLVAVVAEQGTEGEKAQVDLCVALERAEVSLDPEVLVRLARRVERRHRFGLPAVSCGGDPPTRACSCLEQALEEPGVRGRRAVLRRAAGLHWSLPARRERVEELEDEVATSASWCGAEGVEQAAAPAESSPPVPVPRVEPPAKPFRVVKHFRRWYDEDEGPSGFANTKF